MIEKTGKATAVTAHKRKLETPFTFDFAWKEFANIEEVKAANAYPSDKEVVNFLNAKEKQNARGKQLNIELDARGIVKPTAENNEQVRLTEMFKLLQTVKIPGTTERRYTDEQARTMAAENTGIDWDDSEDE